MLKVFTVFDSKSEAFLTPFFLRSTGEAIRVFGDAVADPKHQFGAHPEDYTLFELGEWEESTGELKILPTPQSVILAVALKAIA